ncbi:MAG: glycosyltransferase family 2 protein [Bacteroidales bacterium]|nr:glycosyltransferase family 2 protein [Bacteroidales bacterium]
MKIVAVVVTYNRLALLQRTILQLHRQTRPLDDIVVVNNGSTDGTAEWLATQTDLTVITQDNLGGAGGFKTGIARAYDDCAEWIWCMDDDVFPADDCLATLLNTLAVKEADILAPRRWQEGRIICNDFKDYNLTRPFSSMYVGRIAKLEVTEPTYVAGTAFEGPLIRRGVVKLVGLPNSELFIFCDDTDYCRRANMIGFRILYVPDARMEKALFFSDDTWAEREQKKKWKRFYQVRNSTYLNHHYGLNWGVRYLRGFIGVMGYILTAAVTAPFSRAWSYADIPRLWRAYLDGIHERLGKM